MGERERERAVRRDGICPRRLAFGKDMSFGHIKGREKGRWTSGRICLMYPDGYKRRSAENGLSWSVPRWLQL